MSFSAQWFNQLSDVDQSVLATVHTSRYRPTVEDVMEQTEHFDAAFRDTLLDFVDGLHGRGYTLSHRLRVESKHV
jgi:hypothetical protein